MNFSLYVKDGEPILQLPDGIDPNEFLIGYNYLTGNDNRCCPRCWPLDGTLWPLDKSKRPKLPRHEGCRCLYQPIPRRSYMRKEDPFRPNKLERTFLLRGILKGDGTISLKGPRGGDAHKKIIRADRIRGTMEDWIKILPEKIQRGFFVTDYAYKIWKMNKIKAIDLINLNTFELKTDEELKYLLENTR